MNRRVGLDALGVLMAAMTDRDLRRMRPDNLAVNAIDEKREAQLQRCREDQAARYACQEADKRNQRLDRERKSAKEAKNGSVPW